MKKYTLPLRLEPELEKKLKSLSFNLDANKTKIIKYLLNQAYQDFQRGNLKKDDIK